MVRHVIYGALVGRFIMKLAERFTMSYGKFVPAHIEPCALMMRYGNKDILCAVVRNSIIARRVCYYMELTQPGIARCFYIDGKFFESSREVFDSDREMMYNTFVEQFQSGKISNIKILAARVPSVAYVPLMQAMFSLPPIRATH